MVTSSDFRFLLHRIIFCCTLFDKFLTDDLDQECDLLERLFSDLNTPTGCVKTPAESKENQRLK